MSRTTIIVIAIAVVAIALMVYYFYWKPRQEAKLAEQSEQEPPKIEDVQNTPSGPSQLAATPIGAGKENAVMQNVRIGANTGKMPVSTSTKYNLK